MCSWNRPASLARSWAAVVSGPLATVVVVVDSSTLPLAVPLLLPQPVASRPRPRTAAPSRRARRCAPIIVVPFRLHFPGRDTTCPPGHIQAPDLLRTPGNYADRRHP